MWVDTGRGDGTGTPGDLTVLRLLYTSGTLQPATKRNAADNMDGEEFGDDNFDFDAEAEDEDRGGDIADTI